MIWESITLMTLFDVLILLIVLAALWSLLRHRYQLVRFNLFSGLTIMVSGLILIGLFYLADLVIMWGLPQFATPQFVMAAKTTLHLNFKWIISLAVTCCIYSGVVVITIWLSFFSHRLEETEAHLHREVEARQHEKNKLHGSG